jgi:phage shock protein A
LVLKGIGGINVFIRRFFSLIGGKLSRWLKARESRDPEAVYEAAISERLRRYDQLKRAAAGVIYMRNKLARELKEKSVEMEEIVAQTEQAVDMSEDQCALILIQRKEVLDQDCNRLREELSELTSEAEEAKKNLLAFNGEIEKLKIEKVRMVARLKNAQARLRIQRALDQLSYDDDVRALEEVREYIQRTLAAAGVERELHQGTSLDDKLEKIRINQALTRARTELDEIKRKRRPPLAPLDLFKQAAEQATTTTGSAEPVS